MNLIIWHHRDSAILAEIKQLFGLDQIYGVDLSDAMRITEGQHGPGMNAGWRDYSRGWDGHIRLDARTQMDEIRTIAQGQTMETPTLPTATPAIRNCTIIFRNDRHLIRQVYDMVIAIDGRIERSLPSVSSPLGSVAISESAGLSGFNNDEGEWFRANEPYNGWPQFDAATQMEQIKAHFGVVGGAAQAVEEVKKESDPRLRAPAKPTPGDAIIITAGASLSIEVQDILFAAGHGWDNGSRRAHQYVDRRILLVGRYLDGIDSRNQIRYNNDLSDAKARKPDWPIFNAANEMAQIYKFYGVKKQPMTIEKVVRPALLNMIRSTPGDEIVAGFIRRDLQLVLPQEVQEKGADEICKWIMAEKFGPEAAAAVPPQPTPETIRERRVVMDGIDGNFKYRERVHGRDYWRRVDEVDAEITVPADVVQRAVDARDFDIIKDWISENIPESSENDRERGDADTHDGDEDGSEFDRLEDVSELEQQFNALLNEE